MTRPNRMQTRLIKISKRYVFAMEHVNNNILIIYINIDISIIILETNLM